MQIKSTGWVVLLLLGAIIAGIFGYLLLAPKSSLPQAIQQPMTPGSGSITPTQTPPVNPSTVTSSPQSAQLMTLSTQNGVVTTNDFIHSGATLPDPSNSGVYYLTGLSPNGYAIGYRASAQFFTIALEQEPLGQTRIAAENFLLTALGITQNQLCSLNYYIGTDVHTNSFYAGKNLGFSFCPGATPLPQ